MPEKQMNNAAADILTKYALDGSVALCEPYGCGHINRTYLVATDKNHRYILQKINENTFRNVPALMDNITRVTQHLLERTDDPRTVLTVVPAASGASWVSDDSGSWRIYEFVENTICLQTPESSADFFQSALGFGRFQEMLKDFPAETLSESIPNFHNTPDRYRLFREAVKADVAGRAASVREEIEFFLEREQEMSTLQRMRESAYLPTRVTHNDTKLNNVLLDAETREAVCVIDLDTVMPGLSVHDFGDSIRFGAATAAEDEKDLSKMEMDLDRFRTFSCGFIHACPGLTAEELDNLPLGAKTMTLECGLRFLTDYIDGDRYFAVHREGQNLDRTRTQIKLVKDMEAKWDKMHRIIKKEIG